MNPYILLLWCDENLPYGPCLETGTAQCIHKEQAGLHDRSVPLMVSEKGENSYEADARNFLLNTTIAIGNAQEEFALPLRGRKRKLTRTI